MDLSFSNLFSSLVIGTIGLGLFLFGKRTGRMGPLGIGLLMCVYPYFIPNVLVLWGVTVALFVPLWALRNT